MNAVGTNHGDVAEVGTLLHTRVCDLLDVEHPILNAPMSSTAGVDLAAAVSAAGGFGLLGGTTGVSPNPALLRQRIRATRERTNRPFGVGFISSFPGLAELVQVALDERVAAICHSFADPTPWIAPAHAVGVKVLVQVQTLAQARIAADAGADAITAQGSEAGGHTGYNGTLSFVPAVVDAVRPIPVIAAGGIADGRGLAAVLMLGAEGAWMGSRFVATPEGAGPDWVKRRVVEAGTDDTMLTHAYDLAMQSPFPAGIGDRVLRNEWVDTWHDRDAEVTVRRVELSEQIRSATDAADTRIAAVRAGSASGLIHGIEPAGDIVRRLVAEATAILRERPGPILGAIGQPATS
jgi:nitronate monooxygenase